MRLADVLREVREEKGLTQRELARNAGLSPTMVSKLESGAIKNPTAETFIKICDALDVSPDMLLGPGASLGDEPGYRVADHFTDYDMAAVEDAERMLKAASENAAKRHREVEHAQSLLNQAQDRLALAQLEVQQAQEEFARTQTEMMKAQSDFEHASALLLLAFAPPIPFEELKSLPREEVWDLRSKSLHGSFTRTAKVEAAEGLDVETRTRHRAAPPRGKSTESAPTAKRKGTGSK